MASKNDYSLSDKLRKLIETDGLSHAYLFYGEAKDEMKRQVLALARELEERDTLVPSSEAPLIDATIFDAENASSLGIDIVREVKNFLWLRPFKSKKRTVIILGAEELTNEAQNAILKILEDASKTALIILVATTPERLLPTIISRLQKVFVATKSNVTVSKKPMPNDKARLLADRFLRVSAAERRSMVKEITDEEKEGSPNLTINFVDALIMLLHEKPLNNALFLKELLYRRRLMGEYSLNKRLQLAFLSNLWYN